jgi:hypothetical protein
MNAEQRKRALREKLREIAGAQRYRIRRNGCVEVFKEGKWLPVNFWWLIEKDVMSAPTETALDMVLGLQKSIDRH